MLDLKISEMIAMQRDLQEKNQGKWAPLSPKEGRSYLLWMLEEMGEAIAIIKKRGEGAIMDEPGVREAFVEELVDVMMYYIDLLACFEIDAHEFSQAFMKKYSKNMARDYASEYKEYLQSK
ncbi:MAG: nucleotide pyrophosphohydrolase [Firmicutes bacterium]|nr:nucleotide pyrophosphohydrolase [Bacillota bacterium]